MKIYLKELSNDTRYGSEVTYKIINLDECCDAILQNPLINFIVKDGDPTVSLVHTEEIPLPYEDISFHETTYYPINYCPFCNEEIEIEVVEEIDVTSDCVTLEVKLQELYKRARECDSKKRESELREQIRRLEKQQNYYTEHDDFSEYKEMED